jgi:3',5'-cyclic AMP phosphodiesterase CpdA
VLAAALGCGDVSRPVEHDAGIAAAVSRRPADEHGLALPDSLTSIKFAVIGDSGRGTPPQFEVAAQMVRLREEFPFAFVLMLGDNIYEGPATAEDYRRKFEEPYRALLDDGVRFFAVLGNHDDPRQVAYPPFGMGGQRYYSFAPPEDPVAKIASRVEFFAIDSTNLDRAQLDWLEDRLAQSRAEWKVVFLHHPLFTSGRYRRTSRAHRWALEPIFLRHGVQVVFSGHEHIYQRSRLQQGVQYFVSGGAGSLRLGDGVPAPYIVRSFDSDYHFMLVEIDGDELHFQAIARTGETIDAGTLYLDADEGRRASDAVTTTDRALPR